MHIALNGSRPILIVAALVMTLAACGDVRTGRAGGITGIPNGTDSTAVASITVSPSSISKAAGTTQTFTATAKNSAGKTLSTTVSWSSSNTAVATINSFGFASVLAAGTTTITAAAGSVNGQATLTVTGPTPP